MRFRPAVALTSLTLFAGALAAGPAIAKDDTARGGVAFPHVSVTATVQTPTNYDDEAGSFANADDPAVWVHPTDRSKSLVVLTLKEGGLAVYDLKGHPIQKIAAPAAPAPDTEPGRFNNVDVTYGFRLQGRRVDLALVSDRGRDRMRAYAFDPRALAAGRPPLTDVTAPDAPRVFARTEAEVDEARTAYGLAAYVDDGTTYAVVSQRHDTALALLRLVAVGGKVSYRSSDTVRMPAEYKLPNGVRWTPCLEPGERPQFEGMAVDQTEHVLYAGQEVVGLWRIEVEDGEFDDAKLVDKVTSFGVPATYDPQTEECTPGVDPGYGGDHLTADAEGVTIYHGKHGRGYILMSSQGDSTFVVYSRQKGNRFLGAFDVTAGEVADGSQHSDGAMVVNVGLGPDFPRGLLITHDGEAEPAIEGRGDATNAKFIPWDRVAAAFPNQLLIDTWSFDPRHPEAR